MSEEKWLSSLQLLEWHMQRGPFVYWKETAKQVLDAVEKPLHARIAKLEQENARLRDALEKIAAFDKMTLLGDPADYDFNAEDAYSAGATDAYCDAAETAKQALEGWKP